MLPHIYKDNGTISIGMPDGSMKQIDTAHRNYEEIVEAMKAGLDDKVINLINIAAQVERSIRASANTDNVRIQDGEVLFQGEPIHNSLTTKIITMADEGFDIGHMVTFLENLMENPSYRAVNELYNFMEVGAIPITENGTFLTYKKIKGDWTDVYTGKFDNSIGAEPEMPRNQVNEDSSQTCSAGLHVCSYEYLPSFGTSPGNRVVICEVNPRDVVSIPDDYNNTKMRVCRYKVIGEVEDYTEEDILSRQSVMTTEEVPQPAPEVPADQLADHGKAVGKMISNELDNDEITIAHVKSALSSLNVYDDSIESILVALEDGNHRKIGKAISKAIKHGNLSPYPFEDAIMEIKAEDGAPDYHDDDEDEDETCYRCSGELDGNGDCAICDGDEEDELECPRCATTYEDGDDECASCGYYFE